MNRLPNWMVTGLTVTGLAFLGLWCFNSVLLQSFWYSSTAFLPQNMVNEVVRVAVRQPETQRLVHQSMEEYLQTPAGQKVIESLLESPQVKAAIIKQMNSPEVEEAFVQLMKKPKNQEKLMEAMKSLPDFQWLLELKQALKEPLEE